MRFSPRAASRIRLCRRPRNGVVGGGRKQVEAPAGPYDKLRAPSMVEGQAMLQFLASKLAPAPPSCRCASRGRCTHLPFAKAGAVP